MEQQQQRDYYAQTAVLYDSMHVRPGDEHFVALEYIAALLHVVRAKSVLDVGSGTGRAVRFLRQRHPDLQIEGVEPVEQLRAQALASGIVLHDAIAENLPFDGDSFDVVISSGLMHHVPNPASVVSEMTRVARSGVMISDTNRFAQRSKAVGVLKMATHHAGLWPTFEWFRTRGRGYMSSAGDGIFYSYSIFDSVPQLQTWADTVFIIPTVPERKAALPELGVRHGLLVACREPSGPGWAGR
jgi:ubiquinone/menaquinone biosynthesis C-methylase UbiE